MIDTVTPKIGLPLVKKGRKITQQAVGLTNMIGLDGSNFWNVAEVVGKILGHDASYYKRMEIEEPDQISTGEVISEVSEKISIQLGEDNEIIVTR